VISTWCRRQNEALSGRTAAIQGFGNVGRHASLALQRQGVCVIAVSDSRGRVMAEDGLSLDELVLHADATGTVVGFPDSDAITNDDLLSSDCDILVPAALGGCISSDNVEMIRSEIVVEGPMRRSRRRPMSYSVFAATPSCPTSWRTRAE
jgi:glutamate dehydrogenase (NAD(P)+)